MTDEHKVKFENLVTLFSNQEISQQDLELQLFATIRDVMQLAEQTSSQQLTDEQKEAVLGQVAKLINKD